MKRLIILTEFEADCLIQAASGTFCSEEDTEAVFNGSRRKINAATKAFNALGYNAREIPDNSTVLVLTDGEAGAVRSVLDVSLDTLESEIPGRQGVETARLVRTVLNRLDAGRRKAGRN